ncbi:MAG: DUF2785 domain-containing protein [Mycobacteriales bacterium]
MHTRDFWRDLPGSDFAVPAGGSVAELTPALLELLGSADAELRDEVAYYTLATWIERDHYSASELRDIAHRLAANFAVGIGDSGTPSVLLRSFSALVLTEVIARDSVSSFLDETEVHQLLDRSLVYLAAEQDTRGYVDGLGWAHAGAHAADLLAAFAQHPHVGLDQLARVLEGIAAKVKAPSDFIFMDDEDERFAAAVLDVLDRRLLPTVAVGAWAEGIAKPQHRDWTTSFRERRENVARQNARNFLRTFYLRLTLADEPPFGAAEIAARVVSALRCIPAVATAPGRTGRGSREVSRL